MTARSKPNTFLADANARDEGIEQDWAASNEQWWDWYMSLAYDEAGLPAPVEGPALPDLPPLPADRLDEELEAPYPLSRRSIERFRRDGYVKLKEVCSPAALLQLRAELEVLLFRAASDAPAMRFPSAEMMWTTSPVARAFVFSRRLARLAAELLGVRAVRLYHDNALCKLPGCGRTPWHYDAHHYPIASRNVVTVWLPLQPTPRAMGTLTFAPGIDLWRKVADVPFDKFGDSYDRRIADVIRDEGVEVDDGPFELGEVSFHHTWSLHSAGSNRTTMPRMAWATTYLEDGATMIDVPTLVSGDYEKFMPGVRPSEPIASPLNPVLYEAQL